MPNGFGKRRHGDDEECGCQGFVSDCERVGLPWHQWLASAVSSARRRGCSKATSAEAEQAATEALTLGTAAGFPDDAFTFFGAQLIVVNWMQGRLHEMTPLIQQATKDAPGARLFRPVLACGTGFDGAPRGSATATSTRNSPTTCR